MSPKRVVPFKISSIDSLGQGVSKESDKITFIPKSAVGDEGEAEVLAEKKGVAFARIKTLSISSPIRVKAPCPHFEQCPSCHYQHLSYENELKFKKESLEKLFHRVNTPDIEVVGSDERLGYRNRIQLHYDLSTKKIGMLDAKAHTILPVPECMIGRPEITSGLRDLYQNERWLKEAPQHPRQGHVELYWRDQELHISWNRPYAEGGFTQVFEAMNQKLKATLANWGPLAKTPELLDLFGGNGNLSNGLSYSKRLCVDQYKALPGNDFFSQDLYSTTALPTVQRELRARKMKPVALLLDPPRSGLKDLNLWVDSLNAQSIAYVSCDPHTLVRDVSALTGFEITGAFLFDFFPSTFHFETMLFLERKS